MFNKIKGISASAAILLLPTVLLASQSHAHAYAGGQTDSDFGPGFELPATVFQQFSLKQSPSWGGKFPAKGDIPGFLGSHHPYFRGHHRGHRKWKDCDTPTNPVPVPAAAVLMSSALVGLAGIARGRKNRAA